MGGSSATATRLQGVQWDDRTRMFGTGADRDGFMDARERRGCGTTIRDRVRASTYGDRGQIFIVR